MNLTNARATFGLNALATPTNGAASGSIQVGLSNASASLNNVTKIHSFEAVIAGSASDLVIDISALDSTGSTAWTPGTRQVETQTIVAGAGITADGTMAMTLTSGVVTGSPLTVNVALTISAHTTAALIAQAAVDALNASAAVSARYTATRSGADIILSRVASKAYTVNGATVSLWPADDATLNLAIPSGLGVTAAASSVSTTPGVLTVGAYAPDLTGNDVFGDATGGMATVYALYIKNDATGDTALVTQSTILADYPLPAGGALAIGNSAIVINGSDITIEPNATNCKVTITLAGT